MIFYEKKTSTEIQMDKFLERNNNILKNPILKNFLKDNYQLVKNAVITQLRKTKTTLIKLLNYILKE